LCFDKAGSIVKARNKAASDLRIEGTRVTSLVTLEDLLDPRNDLMRGRVARLVKVNNTVLLQDINGALRGRIAARKGSEVGSFDVQFVEVLQEERP